MWGRRSPDHRSHDLLADISDQLAAILQTMLRLEQCLIRIELGPYEPPAGEDSEQTQDLSAFVRRLPPGPEPRSEPPAQQS